MPLDINLFRKHAGGDPDLIKASQRKRFKSEAIVDEIIAKDEAWRRMTGDIDDLKKERNKVQKEVGIKMKAKEECGDMVARIKAIGDEIEKVEEQQKLLKVEVDSLVNKVGNIVYDDVPVGNDEDTGNRVERKWGTPRDGKGLLNHHDLLWRIGGYEPERGAAVAGHRAYFLKGPGVLLNQAFQAYGLAFLGKRGYTALQPPYFMKKDVMSGVAQLEQFDEELYKLSGDGDDKYLIATSEQPICGYHMNEWIREDTMPLRYAGLSTCFRKEAGSHGKDTWGIFRVHQFEKVEQFVLSEGNLEVSAKLQDEMIHAAEEFYQSLGFPYHVINIVSGALNNAAIRKFDLECWFPGYNSYRELVSCSNCTDYQSRPMEIRSGQKKMGEREKKYVHMLNATLCATGRAICCLLETYQEADGVRIPEVLVPYMGGITFLPFVRESMLPQGAKAPDATKKEEKVAAPAPAAAKKEEKVAAPAPTAAPAAASTTDPVLAAAITAKADEVRALKADKATDKALIAKAVEELQALKLQANPNAAAPAPKEKKEDKKKADTAAAKPAEVVVGLPPAVPVLPPKYTSPAPSKVTKSASAGIFTNDKIDLVKLDALLLDFSYVSGYKPAKVDAEALQLCKALDLSSYANVKRWYNSVTSYSEEELSKWI